MYPVASNRFHTLAIQDAPKTRVRIYFIDDTVDCTDDYDVRAHGTMLVGTAGDTDSNGRISENGITFDEFFNPEKNIMVGDCVSSQISMTLLNYDGALNGFTFGRCKVYLDVYDPEYTVLYGHEAWWPCPMGVYVIEQPIKTKQNLVSVHGFDQMQKLDTIADSWWNSIDWSSGVSFIQMVNGIASEVGVSVSANSASSMQNSAASFRFAVTECENVTFRQVLSLIGEATSTNARFDRNGALEMKKFSNVYLDGDVVEIDTDVVGNQCLSIDVAEYSVAKYGKIKYRIGLSSGRTAGSGVGENTYYIIDNPFLNPAIEEPGGTVPGDVLDVLVPIRAIGEYNPICGRFIMDWSIESGDMIKIKRSGTTYIMPIFQQKMTWRGGYVVSELMSDGDRIRPEWSTRSNEEFVPFSSRSIRAEKVINETGWYRILRMNYGRQDHTNPSGASYAVIDINLIMQKHESHTIQFRANYENSKFCNETSSCWQPSWPIIDKIRYTYDSGGGYDAAAYIDIHLDGPIKAVVTAFCDVYVRTDLQAATIPGGLDPVADAPAGETVLATYEFESNLFLAGLIRKVQSYDVTVSANSYLKIDSFSGLGVSTSNYLISMTIRGFGGFQSYAVQLMKGTNGTDIYFGVATAGRYQFAVEYWFMKA